MAHATKKSLFERLRGGRLLRVVATITALVVFQNAFACDCDAASQAATGEIVVSQSDIALDASESPAQPDDECCALCSSCAYCGCCSAAIGTRVAAENLGSASPELTITAATSAQVIWTPPTLLRPPIRIA